MSRKARKPSSGASRRPSQSTRRSTRGRVSVAKPAPSAQAGGGRSNFGNEREEDDTTARLQDQRIHRLSGPWRGPDRRDRRAGSRRRAARAFRHQFRQGQDDAAGADLEGRLRRHAQARRRRRWSSRRSRRSRAAPASSGRCGRAGRRNTRPRSIPAISSPSPRWCATCIARRAQPEQSYSERQLYEAALDRLSREVAAVQRLTETEAVKEIEAALAKGPRRGPKPEAEEEAVVEEEAA